MQTGGFPRRSKHSERRVRLTSSGNKGLVQLRPAILSAVVGLAALTAIGCYPGAYPSDPFREMHYQQSQRLLEPDRRLPPPDSVPITGAKTPLTFVDAGAATNVSGV